MMNLLRRVASLPGLRRVLLQPSVRRSLARLLMVRFLLAARRTTQPLRLVLNEARGAGLQTYRLRGSGHPVTLQHRRDLEAFFEIFERGEYEPPAALASRLPADRIGRILDVGANIGMYSAWASERWPDAVITAFEPEPANAETMRAWLRETDARVELVEAAAMTSAGEVTFQTGMGAGSSLGHHGATTTVAGVDLFEHLPTADLVKIDIEGAEWPILADPRLADVEHLALVMEYHRVGAPSLPAEAAARDLLERAGFEVVATRPNFWGHGTLWAWKA